MTGTTVYHTSGLSWLLSETESKKVFPTPMITSHMEPKSTKFLGQAFASGHDTPIAVPATRKHDTPINCILGVSPMI